jgi:hypothetical protein
MTFNSKRDLWVYLIDVFMIVVIAMEYQAGLSSGNTESAGILTAVIILGLLNWIIFGTNYTITDTKLVVRCGPMRFNIILDKIKSVTRVYNILSSAAMSFDRLKVKYNSYSTIYISPEDKIEFCRVLKEKCPGIEVDLGK